MTVLPEDPNVGPANRGDYDTRATRLNPYGYPDATCGGYDLPEKRPIRRRRMSLPAQIEKKKSKQFHKVK